MPIGQIIKRNRFGMSLHYLDSNQKTTIDTGVVNTIFGLEHRLNTNKAGSYATDEFFGISNGSYIYKSTDGVNLDLLTNLDVTFPGDNYILTQLTTHDGKHICFNGGTLGSTSGNIEVYSADYATRTVGTAFTAKPYPMHGIDQNPFTKTVCYAEYPADSALTASIWRSVSPYTTWTKVLEVNSWGSGLDREIRHFHTCAADPYISGKWYASSGDDPELCHLWESTDDGLTWTKVIAGDGRLRAVHYFIDNTYIYWSEDNANGGFYRMNKTTHVIETLIKKGVMSGLGYSCIPSPHGFICFYEKTPGGLDPNNSYIYLIDKNFVVHTLMFIPDTVVGFKSRKTSPTTGYIYSYVENSFASWPVSRLAICKLINL